MSLRASLLVVAVLLAAPAIASAQPAAGAPAPPPVAAPEAPATPAMAPVPPAEPPAPPARHGLLIGGGLFGGNISCNGTKCGGFREAGGGSFHVGYMFTPRLGALLDVWAMTSSKNDVAITFFTSTIDVRYFLLPLLWVQAGVGNGHALIHAGIFAARSADVPVGEFAAGYEVVKSRNWAIDVSFKIAQGSSTDNNGDNVKTGRSTGIGAHFTWYATP
jgi:hypothetical protein